MKRCPLRECVQILALALLGVPASAVVPGEVDFQGLLLDSGGEPVNGAVTITFTLFDAPTEGNAVWTETHAAVQVVDGVYDVTLGSQVPLTAALLAPGGLHLEVEAGGETLSPRLPLLAVPYAIMAADAEQLGGVQSLFFTQIIEHVDLDGAAPGNLDPQEGLADTDGDGLANFVDPDNDDDGIPDGTEVAQGSDINLVTPAITQVTPDVIPDGPATLSADGSNFAPGLIATFDGAPVPVSNLTPISFDVDVVAEAGSKLLVATNPNGERATAQVTVFLVTPVITQVAPDEIEGGPVTLAVDGSDFLPGLTATLGGIPGSVSNLTSTSFDFDVVAAGHGVQDLVATNPNGASGSFPVSVFDSKRIFVTATPTSGDLGGIAGADALCAARAAELGIVGATFYAWLADSTTDPATRFTRGTPYSRVDGTVIADDWDDLTDGDLDVPIDPSGSIFVWTNVAPDGTRAFASDHCQNWTSGSSGDTGRRGLSNQTVPAWTSQGAATCDVASRLYCFEQ